MIGLEEDHLNWQDVGALFLFAVLGGMCTWLLFREIGTVFFYQNFTPEPLMWACGHDFRNPLSLSPEMAKFLVERTAASFDCSSIPVGSQTGPAGLFARNQLYFSLAAAGLWRALGVSQIAMAPLAVLLGAGYATGTYVLARMFFRRIFAVVAAVALTLSPVAIGLIFNLRDYSKGPFFLWSLALVILAARATSFQKGFVLAFIAGVIAGTGYGFRSDIAIILLLGMIFLLIGSRLYALARFGAMTAYLGGFLLFAAPVLIEGASTSTGFLVMQGMTEPFHAALALHPAPYQLGGAYSDELTFSSIAAAERPRHPNWDLDEGNPIYGISQSITLSSSYLLEWIPHFTADFMSQMLKGAGWILGYPAFVSVSRGAIDPGYPLRIDAPMVKWQEPIYSLFAHPWMPLLGFVGALALLLRVASRHNREALALGVVLLGLITYPAIQFSVRHLFHLEFIWVFSTLSLVCIAFEWKRVVSVLPMFTVFGLVIFGMIASTYFALMQLQQHWLISDFSALLVLPREEIVVKSEEDKNGSTFWRVPVPTAYSSLISGPADSMTDHLPEVGNEWDVRASVDRILLNLQGAACPISPVTLQIVYDHRAHIWQPLDGKLTMRLGETTIFPAFYRATQNFSGILIPASHSDCKVILSRLPLTYDLPLIMTAVLPLDWQKHDLHVGLGWFGLIAKQ